MLKSLILALNRLSGYVPDELFNLPSLAQIELSWQSEELPDSVHRKCLLRNGRTGNPSYNDDSLGLEGALLETIGSLQQLKKIDIRGNYFSGGITSEIKNLEQLGERQRTVMTVNFQLKNGRIS